MTKQSTVITQCQGYTKPRPHDPNWLFWMCRGCDETYCITSHVFNV